MLSLRIVTSLAACLTIAAAAVMFGGGAFAQDANAPAGKSFDTEKRTLWTTSNIRGTPDPPSPYHTEVAFKQIKFYEPLAIAAVPGANQFIVAERPGKIYVFDNDPDASSKQLVVDTGRTTYGVAVHPRFAENGYIYVASILDAANPTAQGSRLSRYTVDRRNALRADPASEQVLLRWPSGGHNGGCLRFGPDGYLYLATGDGSGIADERKTGQDLSDLLGAILRIDVDHAQDGKPYAIPADNPFVDTPGARPEIFSYGHRQVWKFSFDRENGRMWGGEVGQDLWEMMYVIEKGGNYGWSVNEGNHPFRPERPRGPTPFVKPIIEHSHNDFRSITAGYVYYGDRLPELRGALIYGDYDTGRLWSLRYESGQVREHRELADTQMRIVAFAQDAAGEVYLLDFPGGQLHRIVRSPEADNTAHEFPRKLSETGLFASTSDNQPAPGLIPYSVNAALWSDGAQKERFIALPGDSQIEFDAVTYPQPAPGALPGWRMPDGAVLVKTFAIELEAGNPDSLRRLETRILHHERMPGNDDEYGAQVWRGYTYVWNDEQTDAELLDAGGLDRTFTLADSAAPGGERELVWRFPSRAECTLCHTMSAKYALGVNTQQMNKDHDYGGVIANQLATLGRLGVFADPLPKPPSVLPRLVDYEDESAGVNQRARSYLHANCAHCHRKWGGGNAEFQLLGAQRLDEAGVLDMRPGQGAFDLSDPRLLVAGQPERSMILHRMKKLGLGRMPHVASNVVHQQAVELIEQWIRGLPDSGDAHRTGLE